MLLAVLTFRWIDPPTSAMMLEARAQAWSEGDRRYHTDYRWRASSRSRRRPPSP